MASENSHSESATKPCRTCTDFKSWAKQQKKALNESSKVNNNSYKEVYFYNSIEISILNQIIYKLFIHSQANNKRESMLEDTSQEINPDDRDCPLDRVHLGLYYIYMLTYM